MSSMPAVPIPTASATAFKQGMRALVGAVSVVAANDADGKPIGLTATAVTSLSVDPPSLLVCVNRGSSIAAALTPGAGFSVNLLSAGQEAIARAFGGQGVTRGVGRFAHGGWFRSERETPILAGANVSFECEVAEVLDWATHHIVIGQVGDVRFAHPPGPALVYHDGRYSTLS